MSGEKSKKSKILKEILIVMKANDTYISGDLFFALAFKSESELSSIARELHINVDNILKGK